MMADVISSSSRRHKLKRTVLPLRKRARYELKLVIRSTKRHALNSMEFKDSPSEITS